MVFRKVSVEVCRLEIENVEVRVEMEVVKFSVVEFVVIYQEVVKREKKGVKRV